METNNPDGGSLSVKLVPKDITPDDYEELLATDRFFRDCFNEFLSQPIFNESLRFNPITFGFELKSAERENVVSMIREAVYYARSKPQCQKITNLHAFRPITLLPMEFDVKEPPNIKSEYSVEMLESESANEWIKRSRLPMFLNSDLYHYYRMGHLLIQAAAIYRVSGRTAVIYDDTPQPKKVPTLRKMAIADKFALEDTYVCYGSSSPTDAARQYTHSQMSKETTTTTFSSGFNTPRLSEMLSRPKSARPSRSSANSRPDSSLTHPQSVTPVAEAGSDSGRDSGDELSLHMSEAPTNRELGSARSIIPLPSEVICIAERSPLGPLELIAKGDESRVMSADGSTRETGVSRETNNESVITEDTNEGLGGLEKCKDAGIAQALISALRKAFPNRSISPELMLSRLMLNHHFEKIVNSMPDVDQVRSMDVRSLIERAEMLEQEAGEVESISADVFPTEEAKELNEDGKGVQSISNLKIFYEFEKFMKKSSGWSIFNLWLDIDRLKRKFELEYLKLTPPVRQFLSSMRQRYLKPGGEYCLSTAVQSQLQLADPDDWTIDHLTSVQPQLMQTLLSYWAIRFFVHENSRTKEFLKNNVEYQLFKNELVGYERPVYHEPKTPSTLPLRPKSCMPRPQTVNNPPKPNKFNSTVTQVVLSPREPEMPFRRSYLIPLENDEEEQAQSRPSSAATPVQRAKTAPPIRPKTPLPEKPGSSIDTATFFGSERMEKLLKVLKKEPLTGQFLEQFIRQTNNKSWLNALLFWLELQKYHQIFTDVVSPDSNTVKSLANQLFSAYIMPGAKDDIGVDKAIASRIVKQLDPPFEELFDEAEEHVIVILHSAMEAIEKESSDALSAIGKQAFLRKVETTNAEILELNSLGVFRQSAALPKDDDDFSITTASQLPTDDSKKLLWEQVPEQFRDWDLDRIVFNRVELESFRAFLEQNNVANDLFCWMDIEAYRRLPPGSDQIMHVKATDIKEKYLNKKYFFSAGSPATKQEQTEILEKNGGWAKLMAIVPPPALLTEVQTCARRRLDAKWVPLFLATAEFAERQRPVPPATAEDEEMLAKRRRAQQIAKMLEGHWSTTAQEALMFRNALSNEETKKLFHRFLKLRNVPGEFLPSDLLFYDEVQKYKQLYHTHADESLINSKIAQIITCFLDDSHRQPSLQIDIPHEIAEKIVWHRRELGAYLFRDAQLTVFRILLAHWADFCRFRETIPAAPETRVKTIRIGGKLYPMKAPPPVVGINPKHFMEALERRKLVIDKKRALKEKEEEMAKRDAEEADGSDQLSKDVSSPSPASQEVAKEEEEDGLYNPFGAPSQPVRKGVWRYSDYQYGLERELLLNNTDRSTFMLDESEFGKAVEFFPNLFDSSNT